MKDKPSHSSLKKTPRSRAFKPVDELRWLFFDLNSYFASVEQHANPELRGKPIAVVPSHTQSTCAIAASYEAKAYGIQTGTKIYEAQRLCPDLICVLARHDVYVEYHHRILKNVEQHIAIHKICSIDEAACLLSPSERNPLKAIELARIIKQSMREEFGEAIRCSIGLASNVFLAKTATDMQKPDGLVMLHPDHYKTRLCTMKLGDLCGIGTNMHARLNRAGITTIEQLLSIAPKHARQIWGSVAGEAFWYKLNGYEIPDKATQKRVIGHSRILDPDLRPEHKAYTMIRHLTLKVCARLRRYEVFAQKLEISVKTPDKKAWRHAHRVRATQDSFVLLKALDHLWALMKQQLRPDFLKKISITLLDLQKKEHVNGDLFDRMHRQKRAPPLKLSSAIDQLNQRFGKNTISVGLCPQTKAGYVGTKIAFSRVPEREEFYE